MFMDPSSMLAICNLQSTDSVADFGAGSGFISRAASKLVPQGHVFAIEINKDIVARLTREVEEMNLGNVKPIWGDIEINGGSKLADNSVDFVILSNIMFHLDDKSGCINEARRVLKPTGRALLIDWSDSFGGMGPKSSDIFSKDSAIDLFSKFGFTILNKDMDAGDHHYAILFRK